MKNMKKMVAFGMTAILGASMLAGCGSSSDSSSDEKSGSSKGKTELTFGIWDENQRPAMEKLIEAYEKENENVTVKIQLTPYKGGEYWTKLEAAAGGGTAPDVFWLNVLHLDAYQEGGILDDLSSAIADSDINDNFSETLVITMFVMAKTMQYRKTSIQMRYGITRNCLTRLELNIRQMI